MCHLDGSFKVDNHSGSVLPFGPSNFETLGMIFRVNSLYFLNSYQRLIYIIYIIPPFFPLDLFPHASFQPPRLHNTDITRSNIRNQATVKKPVIMVGHVRVM